MNLEKMVNHVSQLFFLHQVSKQKPMFVSGQKFTTAPSGLHTGSIQYPHVYAINIDTYVIVSDACPCSRVTRGES